MTIHEYNEIVTQRANTMRIPPTPETMRAWSAKIQFMVANRLFTPDYYRLVELIERWRKT